MNVEPGNVTSYCFYAKYSDRLYILYMHLILFRFSCYVFGVSVRYNKTILAL